jgi:hypothetical protein
MTFLQRAIGAARLDIPVIEEIEADSNATTQALAMVVLSSGAAGIGLSSKVYDAPVLTLIGLALLLWTIWAALSYAIGLYLLPEPETSTSVGELLRTIGFASSPGLLRLFGFIPVIGTTLYGLSLLWMLVATVVATRQALDYRSTSRAFLVCLVAGIIAVGMTAVIGGFVLYAAELLSSR